MYKCVRMSVRVRVVVCASFSFSFSVCACINVCVCGIPILICWEAGMYDPSSLLKSSFLDKTFHISSPPSPSAFSSLPVLFITLPDRRKFGLPLASTRRMGINEAMNSWAFISLYVQV